jgi:hypothetical protein
MSRGGAKRLITTAAVQMTPNKMSNVYKHLQIAVLLDQAAETLNVRPHGPTAKTNNLVRKTGTRVLQWTRYTYASKKLEQHDCTVSAAL